MPDSKEHVRSQVKAISDVNKPPFFTQLYNWVIQLPENIAPEQRRAYYVALIATGLGGPLHIISLAIFAIFDVKPMAYINIGSVTFYIGIFIMLRQTGRAALSMVLVVLELIIHQSFAVYYLGWEYGYQDFLLATGIVFMGHYRWRVVPWLCVVFSMAMFGWLYFEGQYLYQPHFSMPEPVPIAVYWWNMMNLGILFALLSSVYSRTASRMEHELLDQNQELRETQMMLVQSEKMAAIGKLAAGLTHEINNPIGAILSNTQTGARAVKRIREQEGAATDAEQRNIRFLDNLDQSLDSTTEAAHRISQLVDRMKSFVQLDKAELKSADLHEGIESAIALMQDQLRAGNIEVVRQFDQSLPRVLCRPAEINQVLMHLLQNAIDAIKDSGTVTMTTSHDSETVTIAISDTGRGLTAEEREGLFDLGFSAKGSRVKLKMGLPISQQIITRHQGELRVESTPGNGSTFTIVLPRQSSAK